MSTDTDFDADDFLLELQSLSMYSEDHDDEPVDETGIGWEYYYQDEFPEMRPLMPSDCPDIDQHGF